MEVFAMFLYQEPEKASINIFSPASQEPLPQHIQRSLLESDLKALYGILTMMYLSDTPIPQVNWRLCIVRLNGLGVLLLPYFQFTVTETSFPLLTKIRGQC